MSDRHPPNCNLFIFSLGYYNNAGLLFCCYVVPKPSAYFIRKIVFITAWACSKLQPIYCYPVVYRDLCIEFLVIEDSEINLFVFFCFCIYNF